MDETPIGFEVVDRFATLIRVAPATRAECADLAGMLI